MIDTSSSTVITYICIQAFNLWSSTCAHDLQLCSPFMGYHSFPKDEPISDQLIQGLDIACRPNHNARTCEPLVAHLQHAAPLNETELLGSIKAIINNGFAGLAMKDTMLLEWMRHLVRHQLHLSYPDMVEAMYCVPLNVMAGLHGSHIVACVCYVTNAVMCSIVYVCYLMYVLFGVPPMLTTSMCRACPLSCVCMLPLTMPIPMVIITMPMIIVMVITSITTIIMCTIMSIIMPIMLTSILTTMLTATIHVHTAIMSIIMPNITINMFMLTTTYTIIISITIIMLISMWVCVASMNVTLDST